MTEPAYDLDLLADKITKAKVMLVNKHPFFAVLALRMPFFITDKINPPTMATDFVNIYAHPAFVDMYAETFLAGVIGHEVLHNAFLHGLRIGDRDPVLANIAMDLAINPICLEAGLSLPKGHLFDKKYVGWEWERIYDDLLKNAEKHKKGFSSPSLDGGEGEGQDGKGDPNDGNFGGVMKPMKDGREMTDSEKADAAEEMKIAVSQAAANAKAIGKLPGSLQGLIEAVGKPKVNWPEFIQSWLKGTRPDDYTFRRPNRRRMTMDEIYMPTIQMNGSGVGVLSIDTSGSVSNSELVEYITEIAGIIEMCKPEKVYIIQHDHVIHSVAEMDGNDDFSKLAITGRGGTSIRPSFEYATTQIDENIDWMICFTDMEIGDWPAEAPHFPVLWCATGPDNAPFGTYIDLRKSL